MKTSKPAKEHWVNTEVITIEQNKNGLRINSSHPMNGKGLPERLRQVKRGKVSGFSKAACRRMREFIFTLILRESSFLFGVTLTVPGDIPLTPSEEKRLWNDFTIRLRRKFHGAGVWRREKQIRGMVHWHLVVAVLDEFEAYKVKRLWFESLALLGPSVQKMNDSKKKWLFHESGGKVWIDSDEMTCKRSDMVGAEQKAVEIEQVKIGVRVYTYIMDHCSKKKREQVTDFGRCWGKINKSRLGEFFDEVPPAITELSYEAKITLCRLLGKWARKRRPCPSAPFGCKLGFKSKRGRLGSAVFFGLSGGVVRWAADHPASPKDRDFDNWERCGGPTEPPELLQVPF